MKKLLMPVMAAALLVSLAACNETPAPETTVPTVATTPTAQTVPTDPADPLSALRAEMKPPVIAVANFGYPELSEDFEIMDYLLDEYPQWMAEHDFIRDMPQERIVRAGGYDDWCNLVCVVPRDPKSSVRVTVTEYLDEELSERETELYSSGSGEPILLLAEISEYTLVTVEVIDSEGRGVAWWPYWEGYEVIPEDDYSGAHVMSFSPVSEKTSYQRALEYGWTVPDEAFLGNHLWQSDWSYRLELFYDPGQVYDGSAYIYEYSWTEDDGYGDYTVTYQGYWSYSDGKLRLNMTGAGGDAIDAELPVLTHPDYYGWLEIFCAEDGVGLPMFDDYTDYDELMPLGSDAASPYENALYEGFRVPTAEELVDTDWTSFWDYALDLKDDGVPGDNAGELILYDVGSGGAYTQSYTGTWQLEDGMLHLVLIPELEDGIFIDDSFPVLIRDEELWIGRNEHGNCLPHFYDDMLADTLNLSKG